MDCGVFTLGRNYRSGIRATWSEKTTIKGFLRHMAISWSTCLAIVIVIKKVTFIDRKKYDTSTI